MERLAWGYSRPERTPVEGVALGRLGGTTGTGRGPLGVRRWHPGGPSQEGWALARRREARHRRHCRPEDVLGEAWYPAKARRTRLRDDGGSWVGRLQQTRRVNGPPLRALRRPPDGAEHGWLPGGGHVVVVSDGATDSATHRLTRLGGGPSPRSNAGAA